MSRITILAAFLVEPPDFIDLAYLSLPSIQDNGPDVYDPDEIFSCDERSLDRLAPDPDPDLKIVTSAFWKAMMSSRLSLTPEMKHADAACALPGTPRLNHTGELNAPYWFTSAYNNSSS